MIKKIKGWYYFLNFYYKTKNKRKDRKRYKILASLETAQKIIDEKVSISRYGDGEFRLLTETGNIGFQDENKELSKKLVDVIHSRTNNHLICIPIFIKDLRYYNLYTKFWCLNFLNKNITLLSKYLDINYTYGNTDFTRFYLGSSDKNYSKKVIEKNKEIWNNQDVLLIEGRYSRLGLGNNLFDNTKSMKRLLCPEKNAFLQYDEILSKAIEFGKGKQILIALGPTATILAHDLAKEGLWAIDIGHIDIEYMWFLQGVVKKTPIQGRLVNETEENQLSLEIPEPYKETYYQSIIAEIN